MKFIPGQSGFITALRFYKSPNHSGTHTGQLHHSNGTLLASAVFANETASGWQQVTLPSPVAVTAGTTYVVSYHSAEGNYSTTIGYFGATVVNGLLTAPSSGSSGGNGVYSYGGPAMPVNTWNSSNYWVDVVFNTVATGAASGSFNGMNATDQEPVQTGRGLVRSPGIVYSLAQNVPNPAKSMTTIRYSIPEAGRVSISLHDLHGRLIRQIVSEQKAAGSYSVELDTRSLRQGVYYYQLVSGQHHSVRRLVVE
jgi:hypothetical protein